MTGEVRHLADGDMFSYAPSGNAIAYIAEGGVWLKNIQSGSLRLLSSGLPGTTRIDLPVFSHDGSRIAFVREPDPVDSGRNDIYVWERDTHTTRLVTASTPGIPPGPGVEASLVGFHPTDPDRLLFTHELANLVQGDANQMEDVFVHDLAQGITHAVSVNGAGATANRRSTSPRWLGTADKVAFVTLAWDLGFTDTNGRMDVVVRDLASGTYTLVSVNEARNDTGNHASGVRSLFGSLIFGELSVSADGRRIAFGSTASDLVVTDGNDHHDVYVADLVVTTP